MNNFNFNAPTYFDFHIDLTMDDTKEVEEYFEVNHEEVESQNYKSCKEVCVETETGVKQFEMHESLSSDLPKEHEHEVKYDEALANYGKDMKLPIILETNSQEGVCENEVEPIDVIPVNCQCDVDEKKIDVLETVPKNTPIKGKLPTNGLCVNIMEAADKLNKMLQGSSNDKCETHDIPDNELMKVMNGRNACENNRSKPKHKERETKTENVPKAKTSSNLQKCTKKGVSNVKSNFNVKSSTGAGSSSATNTKAATQEKKARNDAVPVFRARPVPKAVLKPKLVKPKPAPICLPITPFTLKRSEAKREDIAKDNLVLAKYKFHAKPVPKSMYEKPVSGFRKKNDQPCYKAIGVRQIRENLKKVSSLNVAPFKARSAPSQSKIPSITNNIGRPTKEMCNVVTAPFDNVYKFKARPATVLMKKPFVPKKIDRPLREVQNIETQSAALQQQVRYKQHGNRNGSSGDENNLRKNKICGVKELRKMEEVVATHNSTHLPRN